MWMIDLVTIYLYSLMYVAIVLAGIILISGLDDLFIDIVYWVRRTWRAMTVYRKNPQFSINKLYALDEKPMAIMVPAWQEHGVIDKMAELAATTLDYENYHIFVGTYPNDPQTQLDVEKVCARFPNVHKVVCVRPGPTSKADCLNNVLNAILQFEQRANLQFAGFILHDSEDVLCKQELRLFNFLVDRKDLIQLPVYPLKRSWSDLTGGHYLDEFAETHGKDLVVREALAGQMPSAGVGTCFSRRAVLKLLESGNGMAFDVQSLTEDYDIGFRLKAFGLTEVFVRFPVQDHNPVPTRRAMSQAGINQREASVISVREYFPDSLTYAVRQKSRWIIGIVYQGFKTHSWSDSGIINYFLWRDRKGVITNFTSFLAMLLALQLLAVWVYQRHVPNSYQFLSIFESDGWLEALLIINLMLMCNRIAQRVIFVTRYYGIQQGLLSIPRLLWGNLINFLANYRALKQTVMSKDIRRIAWDKTSHEFPSLGDTSKVRKPLGRILVEQLAISQEQLDNYLKQPALGMCIGSALVHDGIISSKQLAQAVAEQGHVACENFDAMALTSDLIRLLPSQIALHYAVLPVREDGQAQGVVGGVENNNVLTLASEAYIDPVSLAAIARKLGRAVNYVIVPKGQVVLGLRHWYVGQAIASKRSLLHTLVQHGQLSVLQADSVWEQFVSKQLFLGDILKSLGHIENAALSALLQRREKTDLPLGAFLVNQGVITQAVLNEALQLQTQLQLSVVILLRQAGLLPVDEPLLKRA
jgi:bacteriophage N4 adsorption protein B